MMEITAIGLGLMMTLVAAAVAWLSLEATFLVLGRSLRDRQAAAESIPQPPV